MVLASLSCADRKNPDIRPFLSTRSGGIGVRRLAQTWSGDNTTRFCDLCYCHNIGLTMSLSGMYFYGHDLGGFSGEMPWSYPDIINFVRELFAQRKQLLPYLYNCAYNAVENEIPINAPTFLYYDDEKLYDNTDSMMFGKDILVAFAFNEGVNSVSAYLPKGADWYLNDKIYSGGQEVKLQITPTDKMPYFVKSASVIPTDESGYGFKNEDENLVFTVYPIADGDFESDFFSDDGISYEYKKNNCVHLKFTAIKAPSPYNMRISAIYKWSRISNCAEPIKESLRLNKY